MTRVNVNLAPLMRCFYNKTQSMWHNFDLDSKSNNVAIAGWKAEELARLWKYLVKLLPVISWKVDHVWTDLVPTQRLHFTSLLNLVDCSTCSYQVEYEQRCYLSLPAAVVREQVGPLSLFVIHSVGCISTLKMSMKAFKAPERWEMPHQPGILTSA